MTQYIAVKVRETLNNSKFQNVYEYKIIDMPPKK